jgi:hypothetical protein
MQEIQVNHLKVGVVPLFQAQHRSLNLLIRQLWVLPIFKARHRSLNLLISQLLGASRLVKRFRIIQLKTNQVRNYKIICHQISNQCNNQALVIQLLLANLLRVNLLANHRLNLRICNTNQ